MVATTQSATEADELRLASDVALSKPTLATVKGSISDSAIDNKRSDSKRATKQSSFSSTDDEETPEHDNDEKVWARRASVESKSKAKALSPDALSLRRSTTIAVPQSLPQSTRVLRADSESVASSVDEFMPLPVLTRSKSCPERAAALEAIQNRSSHFKFTTTDSVRECVRQMYSYLLYDFPRECHQSAQAEVRYGPTWRKMQVEFDREGLRCTRTSVVRKKSKTLTIVNDDILGAARVPDTNEIVVHYMKMGKGKKEEKLMRRYRTLRMRFADASVIKSWIRGFSLLVKWHARVPLDRTRKIKVVVNPHSGKRQGLQIYQRWKPVFELAGIECDMEETKYSGHARDIGKTLDLSAKYEAIVFVGGDGTVNEFMNGVFAREESEWRNLVATTPVSLLCAGTDNAFGLGVGIPTHEAAVYCIIKRKIRPLDVVTCESEDVSGVKHREFACCGVSSGIGADIAMESEATRWLGVHRYQWLKVKRGVLAPRPHEYKIRYVLSDTVPTDEAGNQVLKTYYDGVDDTVHDQQHDIEKCSVYHDSTEIKQWDGDANSIFNPASEDRFAGKWIEESANYGTVGASNVYFEAEYSHPSDGNMDLIIARRGPFAKTVDVAIKYVAGNYLDSSLISYYKIKALVFEEMGSDPMNVDGEVFGGTGSFRVEVVPQLLSVLSEK